MRRMFMLPQKHWLPRCVQSEILNPTQIKMPPSKSFNKNVANQAVTYYLTLSQNVGHFMLDRVNPGKESIQWERFFELAPSKGTRRHIGLYKLFKKRK